MPITQPKLILASGSPRRADLLRKQGICFEINIPNIPEIQKEGESPDEFVKRLSAEKAGAVARGLFSSSYVLAADTVVVLHELLFGKPANTNEARAMLQKLIRQTHRVITGFSILQSPDKIVCVETDVSEVTFKPLSSKEIDDYVATGEPMDKAGAYAAQGIGQKFIEKIKGSKTNVIGLPMEKVIPWLKKLL